MAWVKGRRRKDGDRSNLIRAEVPVEVHEAVKAIAAEHGTVMPEVYRWLLKDRNMQQMTDDWIDDMLIANPCDSEEPEFKVWIQGAMRGRRGVEPPTDHHNPAYYEGWHWGNTHGVDDVGDSAIARVLRGENVVEGDRDE